MTLSTNPTDLASEVSASRARLLCLRELFDEIVQSYHGSAWDGHSRGREPQFQSHSYEYISWMLAKIVSQSPACELSTTRGGRQQVITSALERGLNHWSNVSRLHEPLEQIGVDSLAMFGGGYIEEVPNARMRLTDEQRAAMKGSLRRPKSISNVAPEDSEEPHLPRVRRLAPFRYGWDTTATCEEDIRFRWHMVTEDKNDLEKRAEAAPDDWILEAITEMAVSTDSKALGYAHDGAPNRKQVTYDVMWVPDARIEGEDPQSDEHGVIYTLASTTDGGGNVSGKFIRKPYYFYGPPQGAYVTMGFYLVPGSTIPLSPLMATWSDAEILGRVHKAMVRRIEKYRKGALYDLHDKRDIDRIEASLDLDLIGVTEFSGNLANYEVGGITAQDIEHYRFLLERLQSSSGMDDAQRGNVTGAGTATEVAIAAESSQERTSFLLGKWRQFVADIFMRVAWYAAHDDRILLSYKVEEDQREQVAQEALGAGMMNPQDAESFMRYGAATYAGGDFAEGAEGSDELLFGDLDFRIEPYSMQRRDQRTRKMDLMEALNQLSQFGAAAAQGVPVDFGKIAELIAAAYAIPEIADVVNRELAANQGILSMDERLAAMQKDTAASGEKTEAGGGAKGTRTERAGPPKSPTTRMQAGIN